MFKKNIGIEFTRKELYDMLTKKPISRIASEVGLNSVMLTRAICNHHIPHRSSADWTRISLGMETDREPLTGDPNEIVFIPYDSPKPTPKPKEKPALTQYKPEDYRYPIMPEPRARRYRAKAKSEISPRVTLAKKRLEEYDQDIPLYELFSTEPNEEEFGKVTLLELELSARAMNALYRDKIETLHKILTLSIGDLFQIRNLGVTSIEEIVTTCKKYCTEHVSEKPEEAKEELPAAITGSDNSLFVQLMMEFYKLNQTGQEVAIETLKGLATMDRFRAE